jgi:hypothetical protein
MPNGSDLGIINIASSIEYINWSPTPDPACQ